MFAPYYMWLISPRYVVIDGRETDRVRVVKFLWGWESAEDACHAFQAR